MRVYKIYCDKCSEEIPKIKKKDILGIEHEYYKFGKLDFDYPFDNISCINIGIDLCEKCAENINLKMRLLRMELLLKNEVII